MARKVRLTPLQRDITWAMEEAGALELESMKATVQAQSPEAFEAAMAGLIKLGYIKLTHRNGEPTVELTSAGARALRI